MLSEQAATILALVLFGIGCLWLYHSNLGSLSDFSDVDELCAKNRESQDRILRQIDIFRDDYNARGQRIAILQDALTYWRRRAADKTAEVHRLRRALRGLGVDDRRLP